MNQGLFITVEGTDGSGKTTQIKLMKEYLENNGYKVVLTREPGGTNISEQIRSILLDERNTELGKITEMLLYAAARAQLVLEVIKPALGEGDIVICDRFIDSSYAYQGFGRGIDLKIVESVNKAALDGVEPDITFFFDLNPEVALMRRLCSTGSDRMEREKMDFHMRVYEGYKKLAVLYPERIKTIDAGRTVEEVAAEVRWWVDRLIKNEGNNG